MPWRVLANSGGGETAFAWRTSPAATPAGGAGYTMFKRGGASAASESEGENE